jgi:hypothetical protein
MTTYRLKAYNAGMNGDGAPAYNVSAHNVAA